MEKNLLEVSVAREDPLELVVHLVGEIDQLSVKEIKKRLDQKKVEEAATLIFDLERVEFMASAGLAIFAYYLDLFKKRAEHQQLRVINCSEGVFRVFHLTMLDELMEVHQAETA